MGWSHYFTTRIYGEWSKWKREDISEWQMPHSCERSKENGPARSRRQNGTSNSNDHWGKQNTSSKHNAHITLKKMAYSSRRPNRCHSCLIQTGKSGYYWHRLTKTGKLLHSDGIVRISHKQHKSMDPYCLVSMVPVVLSFGGIFLMHFGPLNSSSALF